MDKTYSLGRLDGLTIQARRSVLPALLILWIVLAIMANGLLKLPLAGAVLASLAAVFGYYILGLVHQLGHAWAARRAGYPMEGIRFWGVLSTSYYPADEGNLPARIHIRRALGGPFFSLLAFLLLFAAVLLLRGSTGAARWVAIFLCLSDLLVFLFGALIPLGFTDGSTLLHWLPEREKT